jgi:hypothetical protein
MSPDTAAPALAAPPPSTPAADPQGPQRPPEAGPVGKWAGRVGKWSRRAWATPWVRIVVAIAVIRSALTVVALQTATALSPLPVATQAHCWVARSRFSSVPLLNLWGNWDSGFYISLARDGYPAGTAANLRAWAFPPLYPLLMRLVGLPLGGRVFLAGLLISATTVVIAAELLRRLILLDHDEQTAWRATWFFLALPGSFLLSAALSESLFVALVIGAFYTARNRRWALACALVALASLTRVIGLLVVLPLIMEYLSARGWSLRRPSPRRLLHPGLAAFALAPLGLAGFALFARERTGNSLIFQSIQFDQWNHRRANPLLVLWRSMESVITHPSTISTVIVLTVLWLAVTLAAGAAGWLRPSYVVYTLVLIAVPLSLGTHVWQGMYRFLVPAFPMAVVLARAGRNRTVEVALLSGLVLLQGGLMALWTACFTGVVI